jgi:sRNA-binding regulator protein Hfq
MRPDTRQDDRYKNEKEVQQDTTASKEPKIKDMVKGFIGKSVAIYLRGKKTLKGRLETVTQYEIIITINHQPVLIMKHAVDYIEIMDEP